MAAYVGLEESLVQIACRSLLPSSGKLHKGRVSVCQVAVPIPPRALTTFVCASMQCRVV